ncbi:MAG TPA: hypothetical protein VE569_10925 [Acidimicrobiia bacterium]|nr:hypothetical protein [Acidimicrobiia bacterium]
MSDSTLEDIDIDQLSLSDPRPVEQKGISEPVLVRNLLWST